MRVHLFAGGQARKARKLPGGLISLLTSTLTAFYLVFVSGSKSLGEIFGS